MMLPIAPPVIMTPRILARWTSAKASATSGMPTDDLGPGADPGEETIDRKIDRRLRQPLQPGEDAVDQDAQRQGSNPADIVGDDAEGEAAERPAEQTDRAEEPADTADLGDRRLPAQELGQRRAQHQRKQTEIGGIERPARPNDKEDQPLIAGEASDERQLARRSPRSPHRSLRAMILRMAIPDRLPRSNRRGGFRHDR